MLQVVLFEKLDEPIYLGRVVGNLRGSGAQPPRSVPNVLGHDLRRERLSARADERVVHCRYDVLSTVDERAVHIEDDGGRPHSLTAPVIPET